ncbi:hypothetical protein GCM10017750_58800 [Streptomyces racemochromogenes]
MPPRARAKLAAVGTAAAAAIIALFPVSFTSQTDDATYQCGPAISAAFHQWPGCREVAPAPLIAAVIIAAVGAALAIKIANEEA